MKKMEPLKCEYCKKDVLTSENGGLLVQIEHIETGLIDDIYVSCDSDCYDALKELRVGAKEIDKYRDIADFKNPILFIEFLMELMDDFYNGNKVDENTYEKLKNIILKSYQYVIRDITEEEKEAAYMYNMNRIK